MSKAWDWGASNVGPKSLGIWLEPWADEFQVPTRSTITFRLLPQTDQPDLDVEITADHIVVWANGGERIEVYVDNVLQQSASATIAVPEGLTKNMLGVLFEGRPEMRLGGQANATLLRPNLWQKIRGWIRL